MWHYLSTKWRLYSNVRMLLVIFGLFGAVYLLPPDTSLALVQRTGVLRVCIPDQYPPLVTRNADAPGIDVELLQAIAERMGLRLVLNTNSAMGRDFNPRNWRVTRAQCQVLAGGVIGSRTTRSFLDVTPPHLETGWAIILPEDRETLDRAVIGFFAGVSGLNRILLSRFLRGQQAQVVTVHSSDALVSGLASGEFDAGISEALTARRIAGENNWSVQWLPFEQERYPLVLGLWKGDLTLKRSIVKAINSLRRGGELAAILERYEIAPIEDVCSPCS